MSSFQVVRLFLRKFVETGRQVEWRRAAETGERGRAATPKAGKAAGSTKPAQSPAAAEHRGELAEAAHLLEPLHHRRHFLVHLQKLVDLLDRRAAALGDPDLTLGIDDLRPRALL